MDTRATRLGLTAAAAALLLALAGCGDGSDDGGDAKSPPAGSAPADPSPDPSDALEGVDVPEGAERAALLAALKAVDPALVADEDAAIDAARDQCAAMENGADNLDAGAAERFSTDGVELDEAQGMAINQVLEQTLCP